MASSKNNAAFEPQTQDRCAMVRLLAPEEIRRGDFVTLMYIVAEVPSFLWCRELGLAADDPVRLPLRPTSAGIPLKVKSVCLPFVLIKTPCGSRRSLDVRQCQLARLDHSYARTAWRAYKTERRICQSIAQPA